LHLITILKQTLVCISPELTFSLLVKSRKLELLADTESFTASADQLA